MVKNLVNDRFELLCKETFLDRANIYISRQKDAIKEYYEQLIRDHGFKTGIPEQSALSVGSLLFWQGNGKEAIEVFQFITEEYPNSPDAFEILDLAYEEKNQLRQAKKPYESAFQKAKEIAYRRLPRFEEYLANTNTE